jgi:hypothetical protein
MANPSPHKNLVKYLWANLRGEIRNEVQKGAFEGTIVTIFTALGTMVFTALVPAVAPYIIPMWKFLMPPTVSAVHKTFNMMRVDYQVHTTASGLAVLENPQIITPQRKVLQLPTKLTLPSRELVHPPPQLLATPDLFSPRRFPRSLNGYQASSHPGLQRGRSYNTVTPFNMLLSQAGSQGRSSTQGMLSSSRVNQTLNRYPRLRYLNEVEYPSWALNRPLSGTAQGTPFPRTGAARFGGRNELWNSYMSDRNRANEFKSALQDLSQETEWEDDRGLFERILDKIDEWLG